MANGQVDVGSAFARGLQAGGGLRGGQNPFGLVQTLIGLATRQQAQQAQERQFEKRLELEQTRLEKELGIQDRRLELEGQRLDALKDFRKEQQETQRQQIEATKTFRKDQLGLQEKEVKLAKQRLKLAQDEAEKRAKREARRLELDEAQEDRLVQTARAQARAAAARAISTSAAVRLDSLMALEQSIRSQLEPLQRLLGADNERVAAQAQAQAAPLLERLRDVQARAFSVQQSLADIPDLLSQEEEQSISQILPGEAAGQPGTTFFGPEGGGGISLDLQGGTAAPAGAIRQRPAVPGVAPPPTTGGAPGLNPFAPGAPGADETPPPPPAPSGAQGVPEIVERIGLGLGTAGAAAGGQALLRGGAGQILPRLAGAGRRLGRIAGSRLGFPALAGLAGVFAEDIVEGVGSLFGGGEEEAGPAQEPRREDPFSRALEEGQTSDEVAEGLVRAIESGARMLDLATQDQPTAAAVGTMAGAAGVASQLTAANLKRVAAQTVKALPMDRLVEIGVGRGLSVADATKQARTLKMLSGKGTFPRKLAKKSIGRALLGNTARGLVTKGLGRAIPIAGLAQLGIDVATLPANLQLDQQIRSPEGRLSEDAADEFTVAQLIARQAFGKERLSDLLPQESAAIREILPEAVERLRLARENRDRQARGLPLLQPAPDQIEDLFALPANLVP